jgi:molybdopterin synthase catalytic subunit
MAATPQKKKKSVFVQGAIDSSFIGDSIAKHQSKTTIGAHQIFLGQVRSDVIDKQTVVAIDYSAYKDMAEKEFAKIREVAFEKFDLVCLHIYHSMGIVKTGEICLFVFVSAAHRKASYDGLRFIVEEIKANVPIFGKEVFEDDSYSWKVNVNK